MQAIIKPHPFTGRIRIPASKSHTIRRLLMAALAEGVSDIGDPLDSLDTRSCAAVCRALGAVIEERRAPNTQCPNPRDEGGNKLVGWRVQGVGNRGITPPSGPLDVGNSGTTLFLALAIAALGTEPIGFTGDEQIRRRSGEHLLRALAGLGIRVSSAEKGCPPITVQGPWKGGRVTLPCPTSQYLSAILLAAPLAPAGTLTEIDVPLLNEQPYVELTLSYLDLQGIPYQAAGDFSYFCIPGGASYQSLNGPVPGDFSSAAFPGCAAVIGGSGPVTLLGLDPGDTQGDRVIFDILAQMGASVHWDRISPASDSSHTEWSLRISSGGSLKTSTFDLNACPDLLPIMAALAPYTEGETRLVNVAHARIKETDRIAVMARELGTLGVDIKERPDGLIIQGGPVQGGTVDGHGDHRVVMALAAAGLGAQGPLVIHGAEAADVTYPGFLEGLDASMVY